MTMNEFLDRISIYTKDFNEEELAFYQELREKSKKTFTENGLNILKCMQANAEPYLNVFSSKQLSELLKMSARSVSGAMKKLIADGYVSKKSLSPVTYGLTDMGKDAKLD